MIKTKLTIFSALASSALVLSGCSSSDTTNATDTATPQSEATASAASESPSPSETGSVSVIATTTMLGDVANNIISCAGGTTTVLMPVGAEPHDFSASSEQIASMVNADLVISNGLGLESGLTDALENAANDGANVIEIAALINPIKFGSGGHDDHSDEEGHDDHSDEEGHDDHGHGDLDPHFWFDMNRMADAAQLIGAELTQITGDLGYTTCADTTATQIQAAESDVREILVSIPVENRILVTDHDALGYLADLYGYEVAGTVIPAGTTSASPSSGDLAALVATIKAEGVTAIFANTAEPTALADAVAAEIGGNVSVITLYVGSLGGPDSPAATYIDMMRTNAALIAQGLQG
ncbi:MAG: zinc ABC transporter substrate-binding protein [Actinobacteria bacterium]|nr:zinc ABC transporter substrate-binding protein [Actinomycetota bacterium]